LTDVRRGVALLVAAAAIVGTTGACDYATRKQEAKLLVDAAKRAEGQRTATGTIATSFSVKKVSLEFRALVANTQLPPLDARFSFADHRAHTDGLATANGGVLPSAFFDGPVVYFHRPEVPGASDSQFGFRAWSKLDFSKVGRKEKNQLVRPTLVNPINPTYLVRLLAGTLSGSVKKLGTATIDGHATQHFRMNVDRDKAFRRLDDRDHQAVDKAFKSNAISGAVFKNAEAWIDGDGLPRRFVLTIKQKLDEDNQFLITYRVNITQYGERVYVRHPGGDAVAVVTSWNGLLNSSVPA
jgi:hypothetical protein